MLGTNYAWELQEVFPSAKSLEIIFGSAFHSDTGTLPTNGSAFCRWGPENRTASVLWRRCDAGLTSFQGNHPGGELGHPAVKPGRLAQFELNLRISEDASNIVNKESEDKQSWET